MHQSSLSGNALIWFGAAVSIAEIMTGSLLAPLGPGKAFAAILAGHLIGGALLYLSGLIGAKYRVSAMDGVKLSFGSRGGLLFAVLNLIQLIGWTAVMIAAGAQAAQGVAALPAQVWSVILGALILLWVTLRAREFQWLNLLSALLLFILSILLSVTVFRGSAEIPHESALRFGEALELSIAMPLSWLPLIADYTQNASRPQLAGFVSAATYTAVSVWMYAIGLEAALYAGGQSIPEIMSHAGLGVPALLIVLFSTVTTTYLDVFSAGMSLRSITAKVPPVVTAIVTTVLGTLLAVLAPTEAFENFLYYIGSVFAPMIAVQIADCFLLHRAAPARTWDVPALVCWLAGFVLYRILLAHNTVCGSTIPVMLFTMFACFLVRRIKSRPPFA